MKVDIIWIGNSKGVRIPKALLELCRMYNSVDMNVKGKSIVISPVDKKPRQGWEDSFKSMHTNKEDKLLIDDSLDIGMDDWQW